MSTDDTSAAPGEYASVRIEKGLRHPHVAQVTLIGPGPHNGMGPDFWAEMPRVMAELDADPGVRAAVIAGEGRNFSYGLVTHVADDAAGVLDSAHATAAEIAGNPPLVVRGTREVLNRAVEGQIYENNRYVATWNAGFLASADMMEAISATMEKREARFTGR